MNPKHGCCAGSKTGELTTSFVGVGDWGKGATLLKGYIAFDEGIEREKRPEEGGGDEGLSPGDGLGHHGNRIPARAAMGLGMDKDPENAVVGWTAAYCPCKDTYFATAWMNKRCVSYKINAAHVKVPNACFGKDTAYSHYKESYKHDPDTKMHLYTDKFGISHIAVEHDSCHPFESLVWMQRSSPAATSHTPLLPGGVLASLAAGANGGDAAGHHPLSGGHDLTMLEGVLAALGAPHATLGGPGGLHHSFHGHAGADIHHKNRFIALSYVNSSAKVAPDQLFAVPSFCDRSADNECPCKSGAGWRDL